MEIICVPIIVTGVYLLIEIYKKITKSGEKYLRFIPIISTCLGIAGGLICYFAFPEIIMANDVLTAIIVGAASGLSATGCNQVFKQLSKYGINVVEPTVIESTITQSTTKSPDETIENKVQKTEVTSSQDQQDNQ